MFQSGDDSSDGDVPGSRDILDDTGVVDEMDDILQSKTRITYKDPGKKQALHAALREVVERRKNPNNTRPVDLKSVSREFGVPYNTFRDNYLRLLYGSAATGLSSKINQENDLDEPLAKKPRSHQASLATVHSRISFTAAADIPSSSSGGLPLSDEISMIPTVELSKRKKIDNSRRNPKNPVAPVIEHASTAADETSDSDSGDDD